MEKPHKISQKGVFGDAIPSTSGGGDGWRGHKKPAGTAGKRKGGE